MLKCFDETFLCLQIMLVCLYVCKFLFDIPSNRNRNSRCHYRIQIPAINIFVIFQLSVLHCMSSLLSPTWLQLEVTTQWQNIYNGEMVALVRKTDPTSLQHERNACVVKKIKEERGIQVARLVTVRPACRRESVRILTTSTSSHMVER